MKNAPQNFSRSYGVKATPARQNDGPALEPRVAEALSDRFELIEVLSRSDSHELYLALDRNARNADLEAESRRVGVKVLAEPLARDETQIELFRLEAAAASRLSHPNIPKVSTADQMNGVHFCVTEVSPPAETLRDSLRDKRWLEVDSAVQIIRQVAAALEHAHSLGVLHLTLQPDKILLNTDGTVLVTDFGIPADPELQRARYERSRRCAPIYMSPEQVRCGVVDRRSDLYSLGVILYELLTGRPPFDSSDPLAIKLDHLHSVPPTPHRIRPGLPTPLSWLVTDLLRKEPYERTGGAEAFRSDLEMLIGSGALTEGGAEGSWPEDQRADENPLYDTSGPTANQSYENTALEDDPASTQGSTVNHVSTADGSTGGAPKDSSIANEAHTEGRPGRAGVFHLAVPGVYGDSEHANNLIPPAAGTGGRFTRTAVIGAVAILALLGVVLATLLTRPVPVGKVRESQEAAKVADEPVPTAPAARESKVSSDPQPPGETQAKKNQIASSPGADSGAPPRLAILVGRPRSPESLSGRTKLMIAEADSGPVTPLAAPPPAPAPAPAIAQESGITLRQGDAAPYELPRVGKPPSPPQPDVAETSPAKIVHRSGDVLQNSAITRVDPVYPDAAKAAKVTGTVVVEVTVNELGDVIAARPISGPDLLKDAAVSAALAWKWTPMRVDRTRAKVVGTLSFTFRK